MPNNISTSIETERHIAWEDSVIDHGEYESARCMLCMGVIRKEKDGFSWVIVPGQGKICY
jgi:hypothetical protein